MSSFRLRHAEPADAPAVADAQIAVESSLYGLTTYSQADLENEWAVLDLERNARVVLDGERVVGYGSLSERGELWRVEGIVHPRDQGRGAGRELAISLEREAAERGARRVQATTFERDMPGRRLLESLGYRPVRVFRELRIELTERPSPPEWPEGLGVDPLDEEHDLPAFHAAHQEAFADHWEHTPRSFEDWHKWNVGADTFDPSLWCVVRDGDEIAAGAINVAGLYGGGWVAALFTRRPWRRRGVGGALLLDAFRRFWERGERSVGLGVDAGSETGAYRVYERAGMTPVLGWVTFEKAVHGPAA